MGWPKRCKSARAFQWEYSHKRLKLAQLLGQPGVFLTCVMYAHVHLVRVPIRSRVRTWEETGPLSLGVQKGRQTLRTLRIHGF